MELAYSYAVGLIAGAVIGWVFTCGFYNNSPIDSKQIEQCASLCEPNNGINTVYLNVSVITKPYSEPIWLSRNKWKLPF